MADVALEVEVSIYFKMVPKLFILSFYECSKIVHFYPLKFLVLMFCLFSFTRHCTWRRNAYSESLTALSWGGGGNYLSSQVISCSL